MIRASTLTLLFVANACGGAPPRSEPAPPASAFDDDVAFLRAHHPDLIVLERGGARAAIAPAYQGRVMTSGGPHGASYGWIHRELIASGARTPHMNAFGGEDRFWLGPEGGPFALYFAPGAPLDFEHWQVPAAIDTEPWEVLSQSGHEASFAHDLALVNRAGTQISLRATRTVRLVDPELEGVDAVAYESVNAIENTGERAWEPGSGLVSIWILSMYRPSPSTTVVLPFAPAEGPIVNDAYFGPVPADRLRVADGAVFFRADGQMRGKVGIARARARDVMGSWDAERGALTIVRYTLPPPAPHGYVNSMWTDDAEPYAGDVVNSYNDGPPAPGVPPMGPFYELESSSPAAALAPGERLEHTHRTLHVEGPRERVDAIARAALGMGLDQIEAALAR